jgi:hypothetical protein
MSYVKKEKDDPDNKHGKVRITTPTGVHLCWVKDIDKGRMKFPSDGTVWNIPRLLTGMQCWNFGLFVLPE